MRRGIVVDLAGRFGPITASGVWELYAARGYDGLFLDARHAALSDLQTVTQHGGHPGIWVSNGWPEVPDDAPGMAGWTDARLRDLGFVGSHGADACDVLFDVEPFDAAAIATMIRTWRGPLQRYRRQTYLGVEPGKGGLFGLELVAEINADINLRVLAETYYGPSGGLPDMRPADPAAIFNNLAHAGLRLDVIALIYGTFYEQPGGNHVALPQGYGWDGAEFTMDNASASTLP